MRKVKFSVSVKNFQNDMLWRLWISDSSYLKHNNLGILCRRRTPEIALRTIHGTATTING